MDKKDRAAGVLKIKRKAQKKGDRESECDGSVKEGV